MVGTSAPPMPGTNTHSPASVAAAIEVGRAAGHAAEVARAGQRDEDHPLAEVTPQREPVDVTARRASTSGSARLITSSSGRRPAYDAVAHSARRTEAGRLDTRPS